MNIFNENKVPLKKIPLDPRVDRLNSFFNNEFKSKVDFFVRVPGRVNIIGEHIDYCGFPVLPMALEQDILVAAGILEQPELHIRNVDNKYSNFDCKITTFEELNIEPDNNGRPYWYNYVLCGIKGAIEYLENKYSHGLRLCVDGNIPPASGLSSSSALVSASTLSFLYAQHSIPNKSEIASLCARSERYIGTQGGGMDQAIAFLAEENSAQYITWNPLTATAIELPKNIAFVVAHSLAEVNKAASNDFNRRVVECRLAAKVLARMSGSSTNSEIITLKEVQKLFGKDLDEMICLIQKHLPKEAYSKNEISQLLDTTDEELDTLYLTPNTKNLTEFKLKQRALHVFQEAFRVQKFRDTCLQLKSLKNGECNGNETIDRIGNSENKDDYISEILGTLLSESHFSLKTLYECSHENLDLLVEISKDMGIHSRLTGAGWGGCIVALCPLSKVDTYLEKLKKEYYEKYCNVSEDCVQEYAFATTPHYGAVIYV
ncbi:N-acetylgalactosamine kinase [Eumeta japonica]|uniref:N-acetylgalactosamine kinase n=1 Tax=Eumeta variegata TaxID=151549 RepID=A0A4C1URU3_EUMVA|nr:N-acetylgalactosamine kinase [Eumeta japonica]